MSTPTRRLREAPLHSCIGLGNMVKFRLIMWENGFTTQVLCRRFQAASNYMAGIERYRIKRAIVELCLAHKDSSMIPRTEQLHLASQQTLSRFKRTRFKVCHGAMCPTFHQTGRSIAFPTSGRDPRFRVTQPNATSDVWLPASRTVD